MKQEKQMEKAVEVTNRNEEELLNEEEQLNIDELMDVQGGQEDPSKNCGLGCYLSGINNTGQDIQEHDNNN